jgi:type II secretion system protein N
VKRIIVAALIAIIFVSIGVVGIWYWGVPDNYVADRIEGLGVNPVNIKVEGFAKRILFQFNIDRVLIKNGDDEIWSVLDVSGGIKPLQLLKGKAVITAAGGSYGGNINAAIKVSKNEQDASISFTDIETSEISYFRSMGFEGRGALSGSLNYANGKGGLEFVVDDTELKGFSGSGVFIPLDYFHTVRGAAELVSPDSVRIKSFALSGEGIYVRIKGRIEKGLADLEVEVMPEASFPGNSLLMLIERYKISEGYYYIPIKRYL